MTANHEHTPNLNNFRRQYQLLARNYFTTETALDTAMAEFDLVIAAAEQRGAVRALLNAADAIRRNQLPSGNEHTELCDNCSIAAADHLLDRADQMKDDDEKS